MRASSLFFNGLQLRTRLLRRAAFRAWKHLFLSQAPSLLRTVRPESRDTLLSSSPAIILSSYEDPADFLVLAWLFRRQELTFLSTKSLPALRIFERLRSVSHVLYAEPDELGYPFFKRLLEILRDFNRSLVVSPEAVQRYAPKIVVNAAVLARIAMTANVPFIPVHLKWHLSRSPLGWTKKKCEVKVGRKIYISPLAPEFRDLFFKQRGVRKFRNLSPEELEEVGRRVFSRLERLKEADGPDLPEEVGTRDI